MERIICCTYSYRPFCKAKHTHLCCGSGSVLNPYSGALWIGIHTCKYRIYYSISPIRDSIEEKVFLLPLFSYRLSFKIFVLFSLKIDNITLHLDPYCAKILDPDLNSLIQCILYVDPQHWFYLYRPCCCIAKHILSQGACQC